MNELLRSYLKLIEGLTKATKPWLQDHSSAIAATGIILIVSGIPLCAYIQQEYGEEAGCIAFLIVLLIGLVMVFIPGAVME